MLPSTADPCSTVGENNCRRQRDPVCRPESKVCVLCVPCVCVMYYISSRAAFLTGWPCRTCTALAALKSPCRTERGCVTDDQGAAVAAGRTSGAGIQRRFKDVHVLAMCQLQFQAPTSGLAARESLEGTDQKTNLGLLKNHTRRFWEKTQPFISPPS